MAKVTQVFVLAAAVAVTGCNMVRGIGQNIQKAGKDLEGAAEKR